MSKENNTKRILFVYDYKFDSLWRDGLWAALRILEKDFEIDRHNLHEENYELVFDYEKYDFVLGWGAYGSPVDKALASIKENKKAKHLPVGLCMAGNASPVPTANIDDVIFYETEWVKDNYLKPVDGKMVHAFGVNTDIYNKWEEAPIIWDWLSVGSFSYWKRQKKMIPKPGTKFIVGEIQRDNWQESFDIISDLLLAGVGISDMLYPTKLRNIYNCAETIYIPADINGGGERCVLEARACGRPVDIERDNPKLEELVNGPIFDSYYYAGQLKNGIMSIL